jgi:large subunit ribosomal protein L10
MDRTQKAEFVESFGKQVTEAPLIVLADYRGVDVAEINEFRRALEKSGVGYTVVKNTLALRAISGTELESLGEQLVGMTGWVTSGEDPIAAAKALRDATMGLQKDERFVIKGGFFEGAFLDAAAVQKIADLPSREELLVQLLLTLKAGPQQAVSVIAAPARDLLNLLKNFENTLSE